MAVFVLACNGKQDKEGSSHDVESEQMLQGIWIDSYDESVAFKVVGDSIFYPTENVLPAHFRIADDTLYIDDINKSKYAIKRLSSNILEFENASGDVVKLAKSTNEAFAQAFEPKDEIVEINQELQKRDTIVVAGDTRFHCYMQVNPTTYQVLKADYNDAGVGVSKVYYDNIVHVAVYNGATKLYSSDFRKHDFDKFVPAEIMKQSILSDIVYVSCNTEGVLFQAHICVPESAVTYLVNINISKNGVKKLSQE